jgi:hypothetical protein
MGAKWLDATDKMFPHLLGVAAGVSFGYWQHSWEAGFAFSVPCVFLSTICINLIMLRERLSV